MGCACMGCTRVCMHAGGVHVTNARACAHAVRTPVRNCVHVRTRGRVHALELLLLLLFVLTLHARLLDCPHPLTNLA